ncbi:MAG TPA: PKD domain-containing protein, partial [Nitrosopumilaceae archaeon]|nr:PKD domain-containing protein [Nitrosopumilaceae archaeon]
TFQARGSGLTGASPYSFIWSFSDGTTANTGYSDNTTHGFPSAGPASCTVTVTDVNGCQSMSTTTFTLSTNPNPTLSTPGCDKRSRAHDVWNSVDDTHQFSLTFNLKNSIFLNSRLTSKLVPYKKSRHLNTWFPTITNCSIFIQGNVYEDDNAGSPCGITVAVSDSKQGNRFYINYRYGFLSQSVSVQPNAIVSQGQAFGGVMNIFL